ncbi:MAG: sigma-54-dependent Fis family transcriptional regulator [Deltaproteobacteria bacterium]|nr:sigma-54-dependent Fis family transcriptional regulator [Deltaproteobacteria bacterium]
MPILNDTVRVLVVDDERNIRRTLRMIIEGEDCAVDEAESAEEALLLLERSRGVHHVVLMDVKLPGMDGLSALQRITASENPAPVIMISGHATIRDAVEAVKIGAYDFLEKPLDRDRVIISLRHCIEKTLLERQVRNLTDTEMVGAGPAMQRLREEMAKVGPTSGRVFITGESGTGKELVARGIHLRSARAQLPFIKVNCAAIPSDLIESELFGYEKGAFSGAAGRKKGMVELADKGTIFLDEVGDMGPAAQAKVLRVLQTGELSRLGSEAVLSVDVRVLAATNKDILAEIASNRFREDLYYRLNVVPINVPPLRDRAEDIPALTAHFIAYFCAQNGVRQKTISSEALEVLMRYPWPGNVRELKNLIERLVIMTGPQKTEIETDDIPDEIFRAPPPQPAQSATPAGSARARGLREMKDEVERDMILKAIEESDWNVSKAAAALGIERTNLHKKMKAHGIQRK